MCLTHLCLEGGIGNLLCSPFSLGSDLQCPVLPSGSGLPRVVSQVVPVGQQALNSCRCCFLKNSTIFLGKELGSTQVLLSAGRTEWDVSSQGRASHVLILSILTAVLMWNLSQLLVNLHSQECSDSDEPEEESKGIFTLTYTTLFSWAHSCEWTVHAFWCHEKHAQEVLLQTRSFLDSVGVIKAEFICLQPSRKERVVNLCLLTLVSSPSRRGYISDLWLMFSVPDIHRNKT